ncbi:tetratricopeptide repeat protein [Magnetovibrio sp. PR-2]|uniref:tetratricopeptide repeat protein n=1 Tax=Magnetovibrio sp. PR-2 TaxID=3120356 RepID=UPI002FCE2A92
MNIFVRVVVCLVISASSTALALDRDALFDKADQAYEAKDYQSALSKMEALAVLGDARAQNYVGYMHAFAKGTIKDVEKAAQWYCQAALQGHAKAMANIARFYVDGTGVEADTTIANAWYASAARLGDVSGQVNLGMNHLDGVGTPEDPALAFTWLSIALKERAGKTLAHEYLSDAKKVLSAEQRKTLTDEVARWTPLVFSDAMKAEIADSPLCKSQEMDLKPLTFNAGSRALRHEEYDLAYTLFETLADVDHAPSQIILAEMLEKGQGQDKDLNQATAWYCRAAAQGDVEALWRLGSTNPGNAKTFHTIGANLGDARAQLVLGRQMRTSNPTQAYKWLSVASNENLDESGEAEELFDQFRTQVTREQKIEGITLAADFWPVQFNAEMAEAVRNTRACQRS